MTDYLFKTLRFKMLGIIRFLRPQLFLIRHYSNLVSKTNLVSLTTSVVPSTVQIPTVTQPFVTHNLQIVRHKSKSKSKTKQQNVSASESEDSGDDMETELVDKNTKVLKINVTSLRLDGILKNALGIARNKIEQMFYESKIRVNGEKVLKKSASLREGDEIDIIKGTHQNNPDLLVVARVEILGATAKEESITLKIRRCKSLIIENYKDKWQGS